MNQLSKYETILIGGKNCEVVSCDAGMRSEIINYCFEETFGPPTRSNF